MAQVASELQERLPARTSSRSLAPIAKAEGSDVLWQEALEPTADAPSGDRTGERSPALAGPLGAVATSLQSGVPLAVQSGQSGAGTITRATGQGVSAARPPPSRPLLLAFGVVTLLGGGAGTLWLFAPKPAAAPLQSAATPVLPSAAPAQPAPGGDPAKIAGGGGSGSAGGAPLAGGSAATDPSSGSSSGAAKGTGRSEDAKLARRAPSAKKSERKKEDKPRRPAASKATPIMD